MKKMIVVLLVVLAIAAPAAASDKPFRFSLSVAVAGLGVADTALTVYGTKRGLIETNGLMAGFVERRQYWALWAFQGIGTAAIILAGNILASSRARIPKIAGYAVLISAVVFRSFVVAHNAKLNRGLK